MYRWILKYSVIIITILLSDLLNALAFNYITPYRSIHNPYKSVLITMAITVAIFYPAFTFLHKYLKLFSGNYMKKGAKVAGNNVAGVVVAFIAAVFLLFLGFSKILYNKNFLKYLINQIFHV